MPGATLYFPFALPSKLEIAPGSLRFLSGALSGRCFRLDWLDYQKFVFPIITIVMEDLNLVLIAV